MANADLANGFRVVQSNYGGTPGRLTEYPIGTAYGTSIGDGDLVSLNASGVLILCTAATQPIGVFKGVRYIASDGSVVFRRNWIASTAEKSGTTIYGLVDDDPGALYEVQCDTSITQATVGQLANLVPSTVDANGGSTMSVVTGGSEDQFQIMKLILGRPVVNAAGNQDVTTTGTYTWVHVRPLTHQRGANAGTEI